MLAKLLVGCILSLCIDSISSYSATFITKCKIEDTKCLKSSTKAALPIFADGIKELGVQTLDPLFLKDLDVSSPNLKLVLKDVTIKGLKGCKTKKVHIDSSKSPKLKLSVTFLCDITVDGHYDINGKILILPIEGNGAAHVALEKLLMSAEADIETVNGKDGVPHWSIKSYRHSFELKDKASIELENLFNGNKELSRAAEELLKSNPNEVAVEEAPAIVEAVVKVIVKSVDTMFKNIALSDLIKQ